METLAREGTGNHDPCGKIVIQPGFLILAGPAQPLASSWLSFMCTEVEKGEKGGVLVLAQCRQILNQIKGWMQDQAGFGDARC